MTFAELRKKADQYYYPALFSERFIPRSYHHGMRSVLALFTLIFFVATVIVSAINTVGGGGATLMFWAPRIYGVFCILFAFWLLSFSLQSFYNYFFYKSVPDGRKAYKRPPLSFELARIVYRTSPQDVTRGFLASHEGRVILHRAGITREMIRTFLHDRKNKIKADALALSDSEYINLTEYVVVLFDADKEFAEFLFSHAIQRKDLAAIADWVMEKEVSQKDKHRWWSKNNLARIPGIGKNWTYGKIYYLEKYMRDLPMIAAGESEIHAVYGTDELKELEAILARERGANALLVGNDTVGKLEILSRLATMIEEGTAYPQLEHKRIILLDTELIIASTRTKIDFEVEVIRVMKEAIHAGNVVVAISDLPSFLKSAEAVGTDIISVLDPFFTSPDLQIIGLCDVDRFHTQIESNALLMQRFERVLIKEIDESNSIKVLQNEIVSLEKEFGVYFSYQSLVAIAESAERYFPDSIMPDKAVDLLLEITPQIAMHDKHIVTKADVLELIKTKTGIPTGEVTVEERDKLVNLEKILHQRIIGQDEAVEAIASAVRRARSGINNPNRPLGSFLFLGPTGVGKTETTKALAEVFFGAEATINRLDMSEYSDDDSVKKLIGSFESNKRGVLSTMIREHPYAVLLLDEFEKTSSEVMNLFLQILDEGFFSDMSGKRINARNLLIIATSNAGSDMIWDAVKKGDDLSHAKEIIVDAIIKAHIFKPELLNRFDGVIVFHPLGKEHLEKIARLQLEKLKSRLAERSINLAINDDLVHYVMKFGTDPKFGARPMNRAIQDKVEQVVADKIIKGEYKPGGEIRLNTLELR